MRDPISTDRPQHVAAHQQQSWTNLDAAQARIAELEARLVDLQSRELAAQHRIIELESQLIGHESAPSDIANARLSVLLAVSAALLVTNEIEPVLELVIREADNLFHNTNGAVLFLENPEIQQLIIRTNQQANLTEQMLPLQQESSNQSHFAPRAVRLKSDQIQSMLNALHPDIYQTLHDSLDIWPPASALLAPLRNEQRCMGAILLYHSQSDAFYQPSDLPFIQTLADLAALAITETYQRARTAALQHDLTHIQFLHHEAQARLDAAQAQLLQSAKLAAIGELSASVAHEINNPLYAARNSLYLVEQDLPPDAPERRFLDIAQGELGRIARIITRMRDFYRPSRAEYSTTDVNSLLCDTVEFVQTYLRHSQIHVTTSLHDDLPLIIAHMDQLRQVFLNIVLNACDAMQHGGELRITTTIQQIEPADQPVNIIVSIADTGSGILPEHMEHLFEPFYTTKPQGTGLGLAISAHIVTQHGGHIEVGSEMGVGTTFTIHLPVYANSKMPTSDTPETPIKPKNISPSDTRE